jgi:hypothetical protein
MLGVLVASYLKALEPQLKNSITKKINYYGLVKHLTVADVEISSQDIEGVGANSNGITVVDIVTQDEKRRYSKKLVNRIQNIRGFGI